MADAAPRTSPMSSRAYDTRAYEDRLGLSATIRSNVANACG
jgi:hypothetical protein